MAPLKIHHYHVEDAARWGWPPTATTDENPSSFFRMLSACSTEMSGLSATCRHNSRRSIMIMSRARSRFSSVVAVAGRPDLASSSMFFLSRLLSLTQSLTVAVAYEGALKFFSLYLGGFLMVPCLSNEDDWSHRYLFFSIFRKSIQADHLKKGGKKELPS